MADVFINPLVSLKREDVTPGCRNRYIYPQHRTLSLLFTVLFLLNSLIPQAFALDPDGKNNLFEEANAHYEKKEYDQAISNYMELLEGGYSAWGVFLNIGNCWLQKNRPVQAMVFFEQGLSLNPSSEELNHNLAIALAKLNEVSGNPAVERPQYLFRSVHLDIWALLLAVSVSLAGLGWAVKAVFGRESHRVIVALGAPAWPCTMLTLLFAVIFYFAWNEWYTGRGIITTDSAAIRFGPIEQSDVAWNSPGGTYVEILDERADWYQIIDTRNRKGWIKKASLSIITPPEKAISYSVLK